MRANRIAGALVLGLCACGGVATTSEELGSSKSNLLLREITGVEEHRVLEFLNSATVNADLEELPGVTDIARASVAAFRFGDPPQTFSSFGQLLALSGWGGNVLPMVLVAYVSDRGNNHPVCLGDEDDNLCFSKPTAIAIVHLANRATFDQLAGVDGINLSDAVAHAVEAGGPYVTLGDLAAVSGIGPFALLKFEAMVYQLAHADGD